MPKTLIIVIILLAVAALGFGILWPNYQELQEIQAVTREKESELKSLEDYFSSLEKTAKEVKSYPESLAKIDASLPPDPSVSSLFLFLQKKASENGLILKEVGGFSISPSIDNPKVKEVVISINLTGSYDSLKNFLSVIEEADRLIDVENIGFSYSQGKETGSQNLFKFDLELKTHSF